MRRFGCRRLDALAGDGGRLGERHVKGCGRGAGFLRHRGALELIDVALLLGLAHAHEEAEQSDSLGLIALGCAAGEVVELGAFAGGVKDGLAHLDLGFGDFGGNVHTLDKAVEQGGVDAIDGLANIGKVHGGPFHVLVIFLGRAWGPELAPRRFFRAGRRPRGGRPRWRGRRLLRLRGRRAGRCRDRGGHGPRARHFPWRPCPRSVARDRWRASALRPSAT